jgi:Holliday junction resolvasome RuvABC endonuclease subunit
LGPQSTERNPGNTEDYIGGRMKRILGCDLSLLNSGLVVTEGMTIVKHLTVGQTLKEPDDIMRVKRLHKIVTAVVQTVKDEKVDAIGIENVYASPGQGKAALQLAGLLSTIQYVLYQQTGGIPLMATASEMRKFMFGPSKRMKSPEVKRKVEKFLTEDVGPERVKGILELNEHERDAFVVCNFIAGMVFNEPCIHWEKEMKC